MQKGLTITQLAAEVERMSAAKRDFVASSSNLTFSVQGGRSLAIAGPNGSSESFPVTPHAFGQLVEYAGIPRKYADSMEEKLPDLLVENVNRWLQKFAEPRMIRTLNGEARAVLSNSYRRLDYDTILAGVLPTLLDQLRSGDLTVRSSSITDTRMYLQVVFPRVRGEVRKGDIVEAGFTLGDSEVGNGSVYIDPFVHRLECLNGLIVAKSISYGRIRRTHLGRKIEAGENPELFSDEALKADDHALMLKLRDSMLAMANQDNFNKLIAMMQAAAGERIANPDQAIDDVIETYQLPQSTRSSILSNLIEGADLTRWGLVNAITALAHKEQDYETNILYQQAGGRLLNDESIKLAA